MKKSSIVIFTLIAIVLLQPLGAQQNNEEFRAHWVVTWTLIEAGYTAEQNQALCRDILDKMQTANMNAVLWHGRQGGTAYYNSSYEPWGYYAGSQDPGYDPLEYAIQEAHARGMELHAWFNVFATSSTASGAPAAEHPEWVCRNGSGTPMWSHRALSPGLEEVRDYTVNVAMEIVNNYDIDGLHLDYVRWNEYTTSSLDSKAWGDDLKSMDGQWTEEQVESISKAAYENRFLFDVDHPYSGGVPEGYDSWEDWWRWSVTEFVTALHDSIQAVKPWVRLSVAALGKYRWSGWQGYGSVFQDAALWFNEGQVDQLTPMHYHWTTADGFTDMLASGDAESWGYYIQDGINDGRLFSVGPGSYILDENNIWNRHPQIIEAVRKIDWVDGFQFFRWGNWEGHQYWEEARNTFFNRRTKIRGTKLIVDATPTAPTLSLQKQSDTAYELQITPGETLSDDRWFIIYRSEDGDVNVDQDDIVDIHFGTEAYTYIDTFSGHQDFNGQYNYAITMADRYWNESAVSNIAVTDIIPSHAPVIATIDPVAGDTIPVNADIHIEFSKTMDTASLLGAISTEPASVIKGLRWSEHWLDSAKTVTIEFEDHFIFDTLYTLTITDDVLDVNGTALDGDNDGTAGGDFVMQFRTLDSDLVGPQIVSVYPSATTEDFDPADVMTIVFDEIIDAETVTENSLSLVSNIYPLGYDALVTTVEDYSVLNFKPFSYLVSDAENAVQLSQAVTDTLGNPMETEASFSFHTANYHYAESRMVDQFKGDGEWWDPEGSGSTTGTIDAQTKFGYTRNVYLPASNYDPSKYKSAYLIYAWDTAAENHLLREHIATSAPTNIDIDTSYTLQCYVYGDGSNNQLRFSFYEKTSSGGNTADIAEVSQWYTIDWVGWKLVEWDLGDSTQVGSWLSANETMDGHHYQLESIQMTWAEGGAESGKIWLDNMKLVKKAAGQAAPNSPPVLTEIQDTTTEQGQRIKLTPSWTDPDENDSHAIITISDTSAISFLVMGNTSGSRVYLIPDDVFIGDAAIQIIVKDFGIGELSDTTEFTLTVTPATGIAEDGLIPYRFALEQNYPNPFNPTTTIHYSVDKGGYTELAIYNLLGKQVARLVSRNLQPGNYSIHFDASQLSSGHYIYQLRQGGRVLTKKMLLLK